MEPSAFHSSRPHSPAPPASIRGTRSTGTKGAPNKALCSETAKRKSWRPFAIAQAPERSLTTQCSVGLVVSPRGLAGRDPREERIAWRELESAARHCLLPPEARRGARGPLCWKRGSLGFEAAQAAVLLSSERGSTSARLHGLCEAKWPRTREARAVAMPEGPPRPQAACREGA